MSCGHSFFTVFVLLQVFSTTGGALYGHGLIRCQFSSYDGHDALYLEQYLFNKVLVAQYNSTLGKMIGFTKKAKDLADGLNKSPLFVRTQKWKTELCKSNAPLAYNNLLSPVEPYIDLRSVKATGGKYPGMLICSAYNFYPKQIRVTWLRNGKKDTSDVSSTDELPNGNWLYQIHSYLEYTPTPGERISCMVEHASLMEPKVTNWDPLPDSVVNKISVGAAGLLLGLVFSVGGLIYYKKKSAGRTPVPTTDVLYPDNTL
ncbi:H-2 class II histocompatibility antigen, E-S beta chain-like isoform X1 [Mugil cephalus]|uniref:H-2 class II histocompatibility antigen, E-S beta chain-like isoform X1 n=1 Tax=Mugil cephalus TaxID=48193 RepID=UPI001FB7521C|nr:H-2 class II histocompatibility antigen, E-S beta chain-like isoform X1 [Mugil cephalus]